MRSVIPYGKLTPELISKLETIVGSGGVMSGEGLGNYAHDEAPHPTPVLPEVAVKPQDTSMVSAVMKFANLNRIAVTPRGAGTGLSGGAVPRFGGIVLSLEKLNHVIEIDEDNFCVTAEAGVTLNELCAEVGRHDLYYPLYPGEMTATIGGNAATNAGGMRAVKYGVTRNFVLGLETVLPTGQIIQTGGKYIKASTAYDLTQLLVGSEGTLAVITQITLKLITPPGNREILFVPFNSLNEAIRCVPPILKEKILPVSIEFMEADVLKLVQDYTGKELPFPIFPAYLMLMIESDSYDHFCGIAEQISEICKKQGAVDVFVPGSESAKRRLLEMREQFYPTMQHRGMADIADVVVPRSRIAEFVEKVKEISRNFGIPVVAYGHAGDGNVHLHPLQTDAEKGGKLNDLLVEIYQAGINLGGTISGEHGLGSEKKKYLRLAISADKLALMKRIKKAFDPNNIMNPGKVL
ncbi:MAG TPA: FAD-binding oxidoreductase [Dehalococcoidales bacterium]|jgi:glycolate oxidase